MPFIWSFFFYYNSTTKCSQWEWPGQVTIRQLIELAQSISDDLKNMNDKMDAHTEERRGETQGVGQCLQADGMATPRAATNELKGSAPAGEDGEIRKTCGARRVEVTEKVTVTVTKWEKLIG